MAARRDNSPSCCGPMAALALARVASVCAPTRRPHRPCAHEPRHPAHVTLRAASLPSSLRRARVSCAVRDALARASRDAFRVVAFSVQRDHLHLIVEADSARQLRAGLQGLAIRVAKAVNRVLGRRARCGRIAIMRALCPARVPSATRLVYVLQNWRKHVPGGRGLDPCSSAAWFSGWRVATPAAAARSPVAVARTWLARWGWRRHGLIDVHEAPARWVMERGPRQSAFDGKRRSCAQWRCRGPGSPPLDRPRGALLHLSRACSACATPPRKRPSAPSFATGSRSTCRARRRPRTRTRGGSTSGRGRARWRRAAGWGSSGRVRTADAARRSSSRSSSPRRWRGRGRRRSSTRSRSTSSAPSSFMPRPPPSSSAGFPASCPATRCGASASPSPTPAPTWRRCAAAPTATATTGSINGQKVWSSKAHFADWLLLLVRTDQTAPQAQGHQLLSWSTCMRPGVTWRPLVQISGRREFNEVFLEDVRVPVENTIGPVNGGWPLIRGALAHERGTLWAFDFKIRLQNGALALADLYRRLRDGDVGRRDLSALRDQVAQAYIESEVFGAHTLRLLPKLDGGDAGTDAALQKLFGSEIQQRACELSMQLGGRTRSSASATRRAGPRRLAGALPLLPLGDDLIGDVRGVAQPDRAAGAWFAAWLTSAAAKKGRHEGSAQGLARPLRPTLAAVPHRRRAGEGCRTREKAGGQQAAHAMTPVRPLHELGFYTLAGGARRRARSSTRCAPPRRSGSGSAFISERFNIKEAATLSGAVGAVSTRSGIATAATNHNTRHPDGHRRRTRRRCTASPAAASRSGSAAASTRCSTPSASRASPPRRWRTSPGSCAGCGRARSIVGHDGPAGPLPVPAPRPRASTRTSRSAHRVRARTRSRSAGARSTQVVLHTFFTDETTGALRAHGEATRPSRPGRDPASVTVWSCFATVGDHLPETLRLKKTVGRLATYLQGYGDLLVQTNGWDPAVLARFRADPVVAGFRGAIDEHGDHRGARARRHADPRRVAGAGGHRLAGAVRRRRARPVRPRVPTA